MTYGAGPEAPALEASAQQPLPTYAEIEQQYGDQQIVRLPGAVATVDEQLVTQWLETAGASRVLLLPPLSPDAPRGETYDAPRDVVVVTGTMATFQSLGTSSSTTAEFQRKFALGDVTADVVALLANAVDEQAPETEPAPTREPTAEELSAVVADLSDDGMAFVGGAEPFERPEAEPFESEPLIVVAPYPAPGEPIVDYAAAVGEAFPDRVVVTMTGLWVDYAGEEIDDAAPAIAASFYGRTEERLSSYGYPQQNVLAANLATAEQFRAGGMFDREIPYVPADPLYLTLPVLPWLCAGLAVVALGATLIPGRRPDGVELTLSPEAAARFAVLSDLAVEVSPHVTDEARPPYVRGSRALVEARDALADPTTTAEDVDVLLDRVDEELTSVADAIDDPAWSPAEFGKDREL
ncbi:hypothetical protein GCM10027298_29530 [Epidermidibacterium keratini]